MPGGAVIRLIRSRVFVASTELPSAALSECTCACVRLCLLLRAYVRACVLASQRQSGALYSDPLGALVYVRLTKEEKAVSLSEVAHPREHHRRHHRRHRSRHQPPSARCRISISVAQRK